MPRAIARKTSRTRWSVRQSAIRRRARDSTSVAGDSDRQFQCGAARQQCETDHGSACRYQHQERPGSVGLGDQAGEGRVPSRPLIGSAGDDHLAGFHGFEVGSDQASPMEVAADRLTASALCRGACGNV